MYQSFSVPTIHRMLALAAFLASIEHHELGLRIAEDAVNTSTNTFNSLRRELRAFVFSHEPLANNANVMSLLRALETKGRTSMPKLTGITTGLLFNGSNEWIVQGGGEWLRAFLLDVVTSAIADVASIVNDRENTLVVSLEYEHQRKALRDALVIAEIQESWLSIEPISERVPHAPKDMQHLVLVEMVEPAKFDGGANEYHEAADRIEDFLKRARQYNIDLAAKQVQNTLQRAGRGAS